MADSDVDDQLQSVTENKGSLILNCEKDGRLGSHVEMTTVAAIHSAGEVCHFREEVKLGHVPCKVVPRVPRDLGVGHDLVVGRLPALGLDEPPSHLDPDLCTLALVVEAEERVEVVLPRVVVKVQALQHVEARFFGQQDVISYSRHNGLANKNGQ